MEPSPGSRSDDWCASAAEHCASGLFWRRIWFLVAWKENLVDLVLRLEKKKKARTPLETPSCMRHARRHHACGGAAEDAAHAVTRQLCVTLRCVTVNRA